MQIVEAYSHLNGLEYLEARKPHLLSEIKEAIKAVDASACLNKISKEARMKGKIVYGPKKLNKLFHKEFGRHTPAWAPVTATYWVCNDPQISRRVMDLTPSEQRKEIVEAGKEPIRSYTQTDFVKDRVAVEVQFGKYSFVAYDLFVKHMALYVADKIDLGVEILPMKMLQKQMSSGPGYYESGLYNLIRQGRGTPAVPLIMFGVAP